MSLAEHLLDILVLLLLLVGPLPGGSIVATITRPGRAPIAHTSLVLLTSWSVVQTCIGLLLGMTGHLCRSAVIYVEAGVLVAGLLLIGTHRPPSRLAGRPDPRQVRPSATESVLLMVAAIVGLTLLLQLAVTPITDYDSLAFHLPAMARWYQQNSLGVLEQFTERQVGSYPYDWEVLSTLFLMPFGDDFLVALPNLVAWATFGVALYVLAVELGARRTYALTFALLVLTTPIVRQNVNTMHVDLAFGALFMAALTFALLPVDGGGNPSLSIAALGMVAGIKTSGLVYGLLLLTVFSAVTVRRWTEWRRAEEHAWLHPSAVVLPLAALLAALLMGSYWYARNLAAFGNPIGHVRVSVGGITLFPGPVDPLSVRRTTLLHLFQAGNSRHWRIVLGAMRKELGLPFLGVVMAAFSIPLLTTRRAWPLKRAQGAGLLGLLLATAVAYWATPGSGDTGQNDWQITPWIGQGIRYAFPTIGLLGVLAALMATTIRAREEAVAVPPVTWSMLAMMSHGVAMATGIVVLTWGALGVVTRLARAGSGTARGVLARRVAMAFVCGALLFSGSAWLRVQRESARRQTYGGLLEFIGDHVGGDEVIAYLLSHRSYLLYGRRFDRTVAYVPAPTESRTDWLESLERRGASVVALGPVRPEWSTRPEIGWLNDPEGPFRRVFGADSRRETLIYRFAPRPADR